ncbi:hypothetical protein GCM10009663_66000 [Kitasatospora arboriphila]|uniref:Uncharacterized protein n=1 Tax=Kitasatospora arboriphila TaxID=258052 RepID=A0ABN1U3X2_9ACTN
MPGGGGGPPPAPAADATPVGVGGRPGGSGGGQVECGDRVPGGGRGVGAGLRIGQVGGEGEVGDGDHVHARVTIGGTVAAELLQVDAAEGGGGLQGALQAGLLGELADGGAGEVLLSRAEEAAGQRPAALVGRLAALDQQDVQLVGAQRQGDHVDGDGDGGVGTRVVGREPGVLAAARGLARAPGVAVACHACACLRWELRCARRTVRRPSDTRELFSK